MTSQAYSRPLPTPQPEWDFYWEKTKEHELWIMFCDDCKKHYFYPRALCPECFGRNTKWVQSSGKGTLLGFAIVERAPTPAFADMVPFVTCTICHGWVPSRKTSPCWDSIAKSSFTVPTNTSPGSISTR